LKGSLKYIIEYITIPSENISTGIPMGYPDFRSSCSGERYLNWVFQDMSCSIT